MLFDLNLTEYIFIEEFEDVFCLSKKIILFHFFKDVSGRAVDPDLRVFVESGSGF